MTTIATIFAVVLVLLSIAVLMAHDRRPPRPAPDRFDPMPAPSPTPARFWAGVARDVHSDPRLPRPEPKPPPPPSRPLVVPIARYRPTARGRKIV
jgi:hypothetical protein